MKTASLLFLCFVPVLFAASNRSIHVERVVITGSRFEEIIRSQLLLAEGLSYTEADIKSAINRLIRLPFVLDARSSLSRGEVHGRYVLNIEVVPTRNWNYFLGSDYLREHHSFGDTTSSTDLADLGYRHFTGKGGLLFATVSPQWEWSDNDQDKENVYRVGYAHYNLLNRGIFASVTLTGIAAFTDRDGTSDTNDDVKFDGLLYPTVDLSMPLGGDHWIRAGYLKGEVDLHFAAGFDWTIGEEEVRLFWEYNTSNDNYLPTEGRIFGAGIIYSEDWVDFRELGESAGNFQVYAQKNWTPFVSYRAFQSLGRHAFDYQISTRYVDSDVDSRGLSDGRPDNEAEAWETLRAEARLAWSMDVWGRTHTRTIGDLRFQLETGYRWIERSGASVAERDPDYIYRQKERGHVAYAEAALAFRHDWGAARLSFRYDFDIKNDDLFELFIDLPR